MSIVVASQMYLMVYPIIQQAGVFRMSPMRHEASEQVQSAALILEKEKLPEYFCKI